jgi:hypothetical protein
MGALIWAIMVIGADTSDNFLPWITPKLTKEPYVPSSGVDLAPPLTKESGWKRVEPIE